MIGIPAQQHRHIRQRADEMPAAGELHVPVRIVFGVLASHHNRKGIS